MAMNRVTPKAEKTAERDVPPTWDGDPMGAVTEKVRSRFIGSLLASMTGDALGMPVEGSSAREIAERFGEVRDFMHARLGAGTYTDDTQMMMAVAESLVARHCLDGPDLAQRFVDRFEPARGYGPGTREALHRLSRGAAWDEAGKSSFGVGSFGNGSAMRVAPVGLLYHGDLQRVARAARSSSQITHSHPLGRGGAAVQALAVALALRWGVGGADSFDGDSFLSTLIGHLEPQESLFGERLETVGHVLNRLDPPGERTDYDEVLEWAQEVGAVLGNDSRSFQSVPTSIYLFLAFPDSLELALVRSVALGGDTDTIAAMTGALSGAYLGVEAIPERWIEGLESGARGREYLRGLADDLFLVWLEHFSGRTDPCAEDEAAASAAEEPGEAEELGEGGDPGEGGEAPPYGSN